jgi:hypothetical protein
MTATTLNRALERMGLNGKNSIGFSAHGFRATAATILNETGFRPDVIERQLAHRERNKVRASKLQPRTCARWYRSGPVPVVDQPDGLVLLVGGELIGLLAAQPGKPLLVGAQPAQAGDDPLRALVRR